LRRRPDDGIVVVEVGKGAHMRTRKGLAWKDGPVMTTAEYFATPESLLPTQLDHGRFMVREAPTIWHQDAVGNIYVALRRHLAGTGAGKVWVAPVDVVLDYDRALVVQPDVVVVAADRLSIVTRRIEVAPDLAVEVLSPAPRVGQVHERLKWFARYGVRECWVVHLDGPRIEVLSFADGAVRQRVELRSGDAMASGVLPELTQTVRSIVLG
jgi:Uma2 family endonuclease